jgi:polar amino acid transport system substrate-binding protein
MVSKQAAKKPLSLRIVVLGALFTLLGPQIASANSVLEKIAKTGVLTAGTSKDSSPFAYANQKGELVGYSVDMLKLVKLQLEKELKRPITLKLVAVDPAQRLPQIQGGAIDIFCGASSFTWARDQAVDFSVSYGITGTRLLAKRDTPISDPASIAGKRVGAIAGTTNESSIRKAQPQAQIVLVKDRAEGYKALADGKIDAFASDGVLLYGWMQNSPTAQNFQVAGYPYSKEGIACMVPENNSRFLNTVDYSLIRFMQGFVKGKPQNVSTFDQWFGAKGTVPLTQDLRNLVTENMQLILDFREELPQKDL